MRVDADGQRHPPWTTVSTPRGRDMEKVRIPFSISRGSPWRAQGPGGCVVEAPTLTELRLRVRAFVRERFGDAAQAIILVGAAGSRPKLPTFARVLAPARSMAPADV